MRRIQCILSVAALLVLCSCGGNLKPETQQNGSMSLAVAWSNSSREIPPNSNSIRMVVYSNDLVVGTASVDKPKTKLTIDNLPPGPVRVVATAYDGFGGNGTPLLRGSSDASVKVGTRSSVDVTLNYPVWMSVDSFQPSLPINLIGSSSYVAGKLRLAGTLDYQAGAAWTTSRLDVGRGFSTTFEFKITNPGGTGDTPGADGFTFCVQNDLPGALGGKARDLGYGGIPHSLAIEFDTYRNAEYGDPDLNHVSVHTLGSASNSADESASVARSSNIPNLMDGQVHVAKIDYDQGQLKVYIDDLANPKISVPYAITKLGIPDGRAYVGFTSSTGSSYANYDIASWFFGSS